METPPGQVTIVPLRRAPEAGAAAADPGGAAGGRPGEPGGAAGSVADAIVATVLEQRGDGSAVVVAGPDAAAVGQAVAALRAAGVPSAGWVGDPSDPSVREMAAELFPGHEIVPAHDA